MMLNGSCLCGSVTLSIKGELEHPPEACHCAMCRKQTGSYFMGVNVRKSAVTLTGEEHIGWYRSSEKVARGFCTTCGATLFWKPLIDGYEWMSVALGLLDMPIGAKVSKHTFVSEKGAYYDICDGMPQHDLF